MRDEVKAGLLREFRSAAEDTVTEWLRRWQAEDGAGLRARYMDDGTVEIEREDASSIESFRVRFAVAVVADDGEPNKPTGFVLTRPWELVPAGWFVKTPSGAWFEVVETKRNGTTQDVTLRAPDGKTGSFPRPCLAEVKVRRGTHGTQLDDAIEALSDVFGGVQVLSDAVDDGPPW